LFGRCFSQSPGPDKEHANGSAINQIGHNHLVCDVNGFDTWFSTIHNVHARSPKELQGPGICFTVGILCLLNNITEFATPDQCEIKNISEDLLSPAICMPLAKSLKLQHF
jgi:hypothetical protein